VARFKPRLLYVSDKNNLTQQSTIKMEKTESYGGSYTYFSPQYFCDDIKDKIAGLCSTPAGE